ncbi:MAG: hydrolase [Bacillales bacterium]|jgi:isopentenyldiphosphate isomerase|nr:hydrolase [Bacillales bacterium]
MELWDIYDINRINTGKTLERGSKFEPGSYHLVVHICIFNSKGEMLIQQRQPFKEDWPNKWDITVGGSAVSGETSQMAAERELFEEIGYKADLKNVRPHFSINFKVGFDDFYLIVDDLDISNLHLQYDEVQQVKWASKDDILRLLSTDEFIPYYKSLIEMCFEMIQGYGAHKF